MLMHRHIFQGNVNIYQTAETSVRSLPILFLIVLRFQASKKSLLIDEESML